MTLPSNVFVSTKVTRWKKKIVRYAIGVISDSTGKDVVTTDISNGDMDYEKWNTNAIRLLNLHQGTEDARPMTSDEMQAYMKKEKDNEIRWDNIPEATEEEIEEYLIKIHRTIDLEDILETKDNGGIIKIDHHASFMHVKY